MLTWLPPLAKYDDKNNLVGFDADIMARLAEMLGVKLELVKVGSQTEYHSLLLEKLI